MLDTARPDRATIALTAILATGCLGVAQDDASTTDPREGQGVAGATEERPPADPVAAGPSVGPGQRFKLADRDLGDGGFAAWLGSVEDGGPPVTLDARRNGLTATSLRALAASTLGPTEHLRLDGNPLGDEGAGVLGSEGKLAAVMTLSLADTRIGPAGVEALLGPGSKVSWLLELDLSQNPLGDAGVRALAAAPRLSSITSLDITEVGMTDAGARDLAASPHLGELRALAVTGNPITNEGLTALQQALAPDGSVF